MMFSVYSCVSLYTIVFPCILLYFLVYHCISLYTVRLLCGAEQSYVYNIDGGVAVPKKDICVSHLTPVSSAN